MARRDGVKVLETECTECGALAGQACFKIVKGVYDITTARAASHKARVDVAVDKRVAELAAQAGGGA